MDQMILVLPKTGDEATWSALLEATDQALTEGRLKTIEALFDSLKEYKVEPEPMDAVGITLGWQVVLIDFTRIVLDAFLGQLSEVKRVFEKEE